MTTKFHEQYNDMKIGLSAIQGIGAYDIIRHLSAREMGEPGYSNLVKMLTIYMQEDAKTRLCVKDLILNTDDWIIDKFPALGTFSRIGHIDNAIGRAMKAKK